MSNTFTSVLRSNLLRSLSAIRIPQFGLRFGYLPYVFNPSRIFHLYPSLNSNLYSNNTLLTSFSPLLQGRRNIVIHRPRRQIGHRFEFIIGKHKRKKVNPPVVPIHPNKDVDKDMNLFETYRDLSLRWRRTTKSRKNKMRIARKWRQPYYFNPTGHPTCMFVLHRDLPRTRKDKDFERPEQKEYVPGEITLDESHNFDVYPPDSLINDIRDMKVETFCIFKSSPLHQHKVTKGDLVQTERLKRKNAGDKVTFGTVLLVGSKDWTIIGKPTVPYAKVEATVEQQTLCGDQLSFKYRKSRRISKFLRVRHWVTILRIDEIVVDPSLEINNETRPSRLLDLWSNRWLYTEELDGMESRREEAEGIYDGSEHEEGHYNKLGLTESYRWYPDPYAKYKWR